MPDEAGLENRLRDLLSDPQWSLRPWPDAQERVRRTARRQRIKAVSGAAGTGAIAVAACAVPLAVLGGAHGTPQPANHPVRPSASQPSAATRRMPMVVGMKLAMAESILLQAGLSITVAQVNASAPPGIVVAQTPVAGSPVTPGSHITLEVSVTG